MKTAGDKPVRVPHQPSVKQLATIAQRIPCGEMPGTYRSEPSYAVAQIEAQIAAAEAKLESLPAAILLRKQIDALEKKKKAVVAADLKAWKRKKKAKCDLIDRIYLDGPTKRNIAAVKKALGL